MPVDDGAPTRPYQLAGGLQRESAYPIVQGYKQTAAVGYRFNMSDPLQLNRLSVTASVSPVGDLAAEERLHLDAEYRRYDWRARARWNAADFYDLFGPTKTRPEGLRVRRRPHQHADLR